MEGRNLTKRNTHQQNSSRTLSRTESEPSALMRVRQRAQKNRDTKFTALLHHIDICRLKAAYFSLKRCASAGVDGVTWREYGANLEDHLRDLHDRLHRGAYRAKPSRRVYIPKSDGRQRPLGIASIEDKIVQRAAVEVLNAIYEHDFLGFSYGFRPERSQHQALDALAAGILRKKVNWILDFDIQSFFDSISHEWMIRFLQHRIGDRRMIRLIQKWLTAGVLQDGRRERARVGSPQGATISPLLANIFLHYVFDLWSQAWRNRYATGEMIIIRYADDAVVGFQRKSDAVRFQQELKQRLRKFDLDINTEKTRLIQFGSLAAKFREEDGLRRPETFDFLGFTHICGKSRQGKFILIRRTITKRMRNSLKAIKDELMHRRHLPIPSQGAWIRSVVRGYFAYYAVPTNSSKMDAFRAQVVRHWRYALRRRSQCDHTTWERMTVLAERWIPKARCQHPWPETRFDARTRGRSPVR